MAEPDSIRTGTVVRHPASRDPDRARRHPGQPRTPTEAVGDLRFRRLMPEAEWGDLPAPVRARFSHSTAPNESIVYSGEILETRLTAYGRGLANLLRLAGAPLPLEADNRGAAAVVVVTERPDGRGQFWTRQYARRSGFPQVIHSSKTFSGPTGLEETVGAGVTMSLRLAAAPARLLFVSQGYFLKLGRIRLPIPGALFVGRIIVGHVALAEGGFDFTLEVRHPVLGLIVYQRARFRDTQRTNAPC